MKAGVQVNGASLFPRKTKKCEEVALFKKTKPNQTNKQTTSKKPTNQPNEQTNKKINRTNKQKNLALNLLKVCGRTYVHRERKACRLSGGREGHHWGYHALGDLSKSLTGLCVGILGLVWPYQKVVDIYE